MEARAEKDNERWLGLTCSACHTGSLSHNGKIYLIEGAGGASDFQGFMETLNKSLEETRNDNMKWDDFVARILPKHKNHKVAVERLSEAYDSFLDWQKKEAEINDARVRYGPGRIDAFGHIYNKVALTLDRLPERSAIRLMPLSASRLSGARRSWIGSNTTG